VAKRQRFGHKLSEDQAQIGEPDDDHAEGQRKRIRRRRSTSSPVIESELAFLRGYE